jgi:hypothetical protein
MKLSDPQMREALFTYLDAKHSKIRIIDEKEIGKSRADFMAVTDGMIIGYEIKSDLDTYARLKTQVRDYNKYFDVCYAVVGESHQKGIIKRIPEFWGVLVISVEDGQTKVYEMRPADLNPKDITANKLSLLWKKEIQNIAVKNGLPKYSNKNKKYLLRMLQEMIPPKQLMQAFTDELFERDYSIWDET